MLLNIQSLGIEDCENSDMHLFKLRRLSIRWILLKSHNEFILMRGGVRVSGRVFQVFHDWHYSLIRGVCMNEYLWRLFSWSGCKHWASLRDRGVSDKEEDSSQPRENLTTQHWASVRCWQQTQSHSLKSQEVPHCVHKGSQLGSFFSISKSHMSRLARNLAIW